MSSEAYTDVIRMKMLATLLIGVAFFGVVACDSDQSELAMADAQPITDQLADRKRRNNPEVVLQLKYDGGELDRIYLTQFRKSKNSWSPPVSVQTSLCEDLCHAGLGGDVCGATCRQLLPVGLKTALVEGNDTDASYGSPRVAVCPALCANHLGMPLCQCEVEEVDGEKTVHWSQVCEAFCLDGCLLSGCPTCDAVPSSSSSSVSALSSRALNTAPGWQQWCTVQCAQGQGGLACNCYRSPFR